jgi:hypothetical protein
MLVDKVDNVTFWSINRFTPWRKKMHRKTRYHWVLFSFFIERNTGKLVVTMFSILAVLAIFGNVGMRQCLFVGLGLEGIRTLADLLTKPEEGQATNYGFIIMANCILMTAYLLGWGYVIGWMLFPLHAWAIRALGFTVGFTTAVTIHIGYSLNRKRFMWIEDFIFFAEDGRRP